MPIDRATARTPLPAPQDLPDDWAIADVAERIEWRPGLVTLVLDHEHHDFTAGQFFQLGLTDNQDRLIRRSYSASSAPGAPLEFFIVMVPEGALTPQLISLEPGSQVALGCKPAGHFTLDRVPTARDLWLISTGTGLGPFISMLRTGEPYQRFEHIYVVNGVRDADDLAYRAELTAFEERVHWLPVVSRQPDLALLPADDDDGERPLLHGRVTDLLRSGALEAAAGTTLSPDHSQVMLCGNPAMVHEMQALLDERGLVKNRPRRPGHVTVERYW